MRKYYYFIKDFFNVVWRKWEYEKDDPYSFRIGVQLAWKLAMIRYCSEFEAKDEN